MSAIGSRNKLRYTVEKKDAPETVLVDSWLVAFLFEQIDGLSDACLRLDQAWQQVTLAEDAGLDLSAGKAHTNLRNVRVELSNLLSQA